MKVLLVEDNEDDAVLVHHAFEKRPEVAFERAETLDHALSYLTAHRDVQAMLLDLGLPDSRGLTALTTVLASAPELPVIVLTGSDDEALARSAMQAGAQDYLVKGLVDPDLLLRTLHHAVERQRLRVMLDRSQTEALRESERHAEELAVLNERLRETNDRLEELVHHDALTGLLNRRGLVERLTLECGRAQREDHDMLVIVIDLDDFRRVNEAFGHGVGDILLGEVGRRLTGALRRTDHPSRVGGDEFVVLLPDTRVAEGMCVAEKIRLALAESPLVADDAKVPITASLGMARIDARSMPGLDDILTLTHDVLYASKRDGKNRVTFFDGSQAVSSPLPEMVRALGRESLYALAQPIVRLADGHVDGYELLSRSRVPGLECPIDFFRACIEADRLTHIDMLCFRVAAESAMRLPSHCEVHLNLFPSTLLSVPVERILDALEPGLLGRTCIEISEQQILGDPSYLCDATRSLRAHGVRIAIDDVGFGRSCVESVVMLEPEVVKIDRRFIDGVSRHTSRRRSLARLLRVIQAVEADAVAEGIENEADRAALADLGVTHGQGYLWSRPAPIETFSD